MDIAQIANKQRLFFESGITRSYEFRIGALQALKAAIRENEQRLCDALKKDLNKPSSESYLCELGIVYDEIGYHLKHLKKWMRNKKVPTPLAQFSSKSFISPEPYGTVLIMSPWNYPVQLCLAPLVGAVSAGNCAVIKPSAYAPAVSQALLDILSQTFEEEYIAVITGGREENTALLEQTFDYIFFTGSVSIGKTVMEAASKHLTPVSLELGGKSPVIVDQTADLKVAARRIAFGKTLNAGQTCVAPDYLFIEECVKDEFAAHYRAALEEFFPYDDMSDLPHIVNQKHFDRLIGLMQNENILLGGKNDPSTLFIEPTLLDGITFESPVMQEEIFGPILPILTFTEIETCIDYIRKQPKPLALYLFTRNKQTENTILDTCSFGGGCINDTVIHLATPYMGFGGVGASGMGSYHGKFSFDTFSHYRSIVKKRFFPDLKMRYRPYTDTKDKWIRKFLK